MDNFPNYKALDPCPYCHQQYLEYPLVIEVLGVPIYFCNKCGKKWTTETPAHLRT